MDQAVKNSEYIRAAVIEYLTPSSVRKIVRKPRVEIDAVPLAVPFRNGKVAAQIWGTGEKILLVHGWAANQTDMFGFVPEIMSRGLCAVTVDLPAHGESSGDFVGLEEMGQALLAVGKHLGHLRGVIAHSVGGAATQLAIVNGLEVEKAVILASPENYELAAHQFADMKNFSPEEKEKMFQVLKDMGVKIEIKSADFVPDILTPALIIHSKDDPVIPFSIGQNLSRYWRSSELLEVDGLKHRGVLKDPKIIETAVDFLTK